MMLIMIGAIAFISMTLKNAPDRKKRSAIVLLSAFNIVLFIIYKIFLSIDQEFLAIAQIDEFNWFAELPMHLCNINMFLIPIGLLLKKRSILGFSFFIAPLGAFMALIFPDPAFTDFHITIPRILGYYGTHVIIIICAISLFTLGFYRPSAKDCPKTVMAFLVISLLIHFVNIAFRATICPHANYFYTFGADISILKLFWDWIPIPYLYGIPALGILSAYMLIVILGIKLFSKESTEIELEVEG